MDVFDTIAGVAFEGIAGLRTAGDDAFGTFCVRASMAADRPLFCHSEKIEEEGENSRNGHPGSPSRCRRE